MEHIVGSGFYTQSVVVGGKNFSGVRCILPAGCKAVRLVLLALIACMRV